MLRKDILTIGYSVMKILIVRTFPSIISQTSYNVQEIGMATAYMRAGHDADIVLYGGKEDDHTELMPIEWNEDGTASRFVSIYYLRGFNILKNGFFPSLRSIASSYDLIQVHEYDQISSWLLYTDKKLRDKVIIYHGPYFSEFNKGYNLKCKVFDNIFLRFRHNRQCPCFTKSNAAAGFLKSKGFDNVTAVGVGLNVSLWSDIEESSSKGDITADSNAFRRIYDYMENGADVVKDEVFTFLYIGKLEPRRNTLFLLDLADALLQSHEDIRFLIVGDGEASYKNECLKRAKKWIDAGKIEYIPKVAQKDMPLIYGRSDCMLFPSRYEIFGMVLMEAMYFGVPVITSNNGGADTIFSNEYNAIVLENDFEFNTWISAAIRMYEDENLRKKISDNELNDSEKLSWDEVTKKVLQALQPQIG